MSAPQEDAVQSAVPIADLSAIDRALTRNSGLKKAVKSCRPADLARDLSRRSADEGKRILEASDDRRAAAMLRAAHPSVAANLAKMLDPSKAAHVFGFIPTDHQAAILGLVGDEQRQRIEQTLDPKDKAEVERLLAHPVGSVGRMMTPKIWRCDREATAGAAMDILRENAHDIEVAQNCYIVEGSRLVGVVPLRELAIAPPETPIADVMTPDPIIVSETASPLAAAEIIQTHDFLSLPVADDLGRLVGAVRVDDLLDAALDKAGKGLLNQGGVAGKIAARLPYFQTAMYTIVRSRITWLILLFVAETMTGTVLRAFEAEIDKVAALAFFIPLLIGTGGNAGSQTISTVIRALALGEVRFSDTLRVVWKEASAGIVLGLLLGAIALGRAMLWGVGFDLAGCVAITILVVVIWANTVGALIPLIAQRLKIDPTVVSGPLITTLVDATGLLIYLSVAKIMIAQLH